MNVSRIVTVIGGFALAALGVSMALTNPGRDSYEQYAVEQLTKYLKDEGCTQVPSLFEKLLQRQCTALVDTARPELQQVISQKTQRLNFLLFSIYRTNLDIGPFLPAYQVETLGAFQNFYIYQAEEQ